jgi:hypothetical protein
MTVLRIEYLNRRYSERAGLCEHYRKAFILWRPHRRNRQKGVFAVKRVNLAVRCTPDVAMDIPDSTVGIRQRE